MYYLQLLRIQPTAAFGVDWTARMIFIVVIGGLGRIEGPIVGAIVYFALREVLADYGAPTWSPSASWPSRSSSSRRAGCGAWSMSRVPALFAVQRRLVHSPVAAPDQPEERERT